MQIMIRYDIQKKHLLPSLKESPKQQTFQNTQIWVGLIATPWWFLRQIWSRRYQGSKATIIWGGVHSSNYPTQKNIKTNDKEININIKS